MKKNKKLWIPLVIFLLVAILATGFVIKTEHDKKVAEIAAAEAAAQQEQERIAAEQAAAKAEAERIAAEKAAAEAKAKAEAEAAAAAAEAEQQAAKQTKENIQYGDCIGTVWVEGTNVSCNLYWGDTMGIFRAGAGCSADNGCVMPGDNGTVFIGGHTDSWFVDLKSTELGAIIHLDTIYGNYEYKVTDMQVIYDTEGNKCRWGDTSPSCILYTCYPFGIQVPTNQRYLVYADPVTADENGVVPSSLPEVAEQDAEASETQAAQQ